MGNPNLKENRFKRAIALLFRNVLRIISPVLYVEFQYRYITHHRCDLARPVRYTEKLQFLRLFVYPKDPLVIKAASRDGAREYVKEKGLGDILIPIYGIYGDFDDIDLAALPDRFVMKCVHACAFNEIVLDKKKMDVTKSRKRFRKWLRTDYGRKTMERHYSPIEPKIIIEKYIAPGTELPAEYKIHVYNGKARSLYVVTGRGQDIRYNNYYIDWRPFDASQFNGWKKREEGVPIPADWDRMVRIAETLGQDFPFVRVDLYNIDGRIYFGELTFTPAKGTLIFDDDAADFEMGAWLDIDRYVKERQNRKRSRRQRKH